MYGTNAKGSGKEDEHMTTNAKIDGALSSIVSNIWALSCPLEQSPDEYIIYNPEIESPELYADDEDCEWIDYMQIHYFVRNAGETKKAVNYIEKKEQIKKAIKKAGFSLEDITIYYEKETGYTHVVFLANILQETH